jgi:hypothetical protein
VLWILVLAFHFGTVCTSNRSEVYQSAQRLSFGMDARTALTWHRLQAFRFVSWKWSGSSLGLKGTTENLRIIVSWPRFEQDITWMQFWNVTGCANLVCNCRVTASPLFFLHLSKFLTNFTVFLLWKVSLCGTDQWNSVTRGWFRNQLHWPTHDTQKPARIHPGRQPANWSRTVSKESVQ